MSHLLSVCPKQIPIAKIRVLVHRSPEVKEIRGLFVMCSNNNICFSRKLFSEVLANYAFSGKPDMGNVLLRIAKSGVSSGSFQAVNKSIQMTNATYTSALRTS